MDKGIGDRRMYQNKIKLTAQEILEKDFKIDTRGYRLKEVDQFLDDVIADYEQYDQFIDDLVKEKEELYTQNKIPYVGLEKDDPKDSSFIYTLIQDLKRKAKEHFGFMPEWKK